jgi:hypothetical protein
MLRFEWGEDSPIPTGPRSPTKSPESFPLAVQTRKKGQKGRNMSKLSDRQREDILALTGQRDEDIDYSDIPPIREIPPSALRGRFYRSHAIYLTDELHAYLSTVAMRRGVSLNDLVNDLLSTEVAIVEALK